MTDKQKGSKIPSRLRKATRSNKTSYQTNIPFFYIEGVDDNMGNRMFVIVVTNVEIENIDTLISTIMEADFEFYTTWNDPQILHDYMVFVQPKYRAGDNLLPWAEETLDSRVKKRVQQLQGEFMRSHISSVDE